MNSSLEKLVEGLQKNNDIMIFKFFCDEFQDNKNLLPMLIQKGVCPYDNMNSAEKFKEIKLSAEKHFFNKQNNNNIIHESYLRAVDIFKKFNCKSMQDYHDLY